MKARLLGGAKPNLSHLAPDPRTVRVAVPGEHDGQGVNQMVKLWSSLRVQSAGQECAEGLKSWLQAVQTQDEGLIARSAGKP